MGLPLALTLALTAPSANNIALSQTPSGAGNLTIAGALASGGVATLDKPRRVLVTTASDESAKTLTIYGTNRDGGTISEAMTGPVATTGYTAQDFKTVTRVAVSAAFTGAVTVGTNQIASTRWFGVNYNADVVQIGVAVVVSGTINYTVEYTFDELMGHYEPGFPGNWTTPGVPTVFADPILTAVAANGATTINTPIRGVRVTQNSFTNPGQLVATFIQSDIRG